MDYPPRHLKTLLAGVLLAGVFFYFGYHRGEEHTLASVAQNITGSVDGKPTTVDFTSFWKVWNTINQKFVAPIGTTTKPVTDQDKIYGAIEGLTSSLGDPYTVFFPPVQSALFASDIRGNFEGVGMEVVTQNGALTVIAPLKGSPAAAAGILSGDIVLKIDGKDTSAMSTDEAVQLIRGQKGSKVVFNIFRKGVKAPFDVSVTRDVINIPTIDTKELGNGTFYIALYSFTADSADLFRGALRTFVESGDSKLVLDLRGNPGGYLDAAIDMASWFLPSGKVVVRESYGASKPEDVFRSKGYNIFTNNLKFVILVDGGSASAAEILSGALSEQGVATLIGDKTFGKGSVQELDNITDDTTLKVTIAHWLTPDGNFITGHGITPAIIVPMTQADAAAGKDPQLDRAKEFLNTGK
ncbi:MAG: ctpA [Parcubacteria group bacterium]|nr:ctpA [Parcubacteria group bacterium]